MEHKANRKMLGTDIEISVISDDWHIDRRINGIYDFFSSFEQEFSRFLPHSSLSILNEYKTLEVSDRFIDLLKKSIDLNLRTDWFFNPLTDISKIWYSSDFESNEFKKIERESNNDIRKIMIEWKKVTLEANQRLDFGWIWKWYAVDNAAKFLKMFGYDDFFINAWGDIYASWKDSAWNDWAIWVQNPFNWTMLWQISLHDNAIATSWNYIRNWQLDGNKFHHILNPKTWNNEFSAASVSIIAPNCTEADAFTKALFNMDLKSSLDFIEKNDLSGFVITDKHEILTTKWLEEKHNFLLY